MVTVQWGNGRLTSVGAIVFDKDGTLADSLPFLLQLAQRRSQLIEAQVPGVYAALMAAWGVVGDQLRPDGLMAVATRLDNEVAAAAYVAAQGYGWGEALGLVRQAFGAADAMPLSKAAATPPFPGIPALVAKLHQAGVPLAVLSGDTTANIQEFLHHYGLAPYIPWSQGSDGDWAKPHPALFHHACDRLQVPPPETWVIGDSTVDGELARQGGAAGWISVTWGGSPAIAGADGVVNAVAEIQVLP